MKKKRILSLFMAILIILSSFPVYALDRNQTTTLEGEALEEFLEKNSVESNKKNEGGILKKITEWILPSEAKAAETTYTAGTNVTAVFNDVTGVMTISGTGAMTNWTSSSKAPWYSIITKITSVVIEDGVISIGVRTFLGCSSLTSVVIPDSVTSIGSFAFGDCSSLTSVIIPDSVTSIGNSAFYGCSSLTSVIIPDSVTSIGDYAFSYCTNLMSIIFQSRSSKSITLGTSWKTNSKVYCEDINDYYTIDSSGKIKMSSIFEFIEGPVDLVLPSSINGIPVTIIAKDAFKNVSNTKSIVIPEGVLSIEDGYDSNYETSMYGAFSRNLNLEKITLPSTLESIGNLAFYKCSNLISVDIPNKVNKIGVRTFLGCSSLTSVVIPDSVTSIGSFAFGDCSSLTSVVIPNSVESIGKYAFSDCSSLTSVVIPNSVESIGESAFRDCTNLMSIIFQSRSSKSITLGTLWKTNSKVYCEDINDYYTIDSSGKIKMSSIFEFIEGPVDLVLPSSINGIPVTIIAKDAFKNVSNTKSIVIPEGVLSIEDGYDSNYETSMYGAFSRNLNLEKITLPSTLESIGNLAFYKCSNLISVDIPNKVNKIGVRTFLGCSSLTSVVIEDGVTSIGNFAFGDCSSLTSVIIPDSVTSIGNYAFYGCSSLTSVIIPDYVTSIGDYAFSYCSNLTSIIIPDSITIIGGYAFSYCSNLTSIIIPDSVIIIKNNVFTNCYKLENITNLYEGNQTIGSQAFLNAGRDVTPKYAYADPVNTKFIAAVTNAGYIVNNLEDLPDTFPPSITLAPNITEPTSEDIIIISTITDKSDIIAKKWAIGEQNIEYFAENGTVLDAIFTVSENGIYTVYARDEFGNEAIETISIDNISKIDSGDSISITNIPLGANVQFVGMNWIMIDPTSGKLLLDNNNGDRNWGISIGNYVTSDIRNYLNDIDNGFLSKIPSEYRDYIVDTVWYAGAINNEIEQSVQDKIGLIRYSEYNSLRGAVLPQDGDGYKWWLINRNSTAANFVFFVNTNGTVTSQVVSNVGGVRPALHLKPEVQATLNNNIYVIDKPEAVPTAFTMSTIENEDDTITIELFYPTNSTNKQYKINEDGIWTDYTVPITISTESTLYVRWDDVTGTNEVVPAPMVITLNDYTKTPINQDIIVTATVNRGTLNQDSYTFTENDEFTFIATDENNNSVSRKIIITNIDKIAPEVPSVHAISEDDGSATVSISYSSDSNQKQYKLDDGLWKNYSGTFVLPNDKVATIVIYARGIDVASNISEEVSKTVSTIDKTPPVITLDNYEKNPTNKDIIVTANVNEGTLNEYSHIFTNNGEFTFIAVDNYNNVSEETVAITNIDKISPEAPVINVIENEDGSATVIIDYSIDSHQKQYKLNDGSWINYSGVVEISNEEKSNTTIYARGVDTAGNISEEVSKMASTQDKTPPVITLNNYEKNPTNKDIIVTATVNEGTLNQNSYTFTENAQFIFVATDNYGNVSEKTVIITNIDKIPPEAPTINVTEETDGSSIVVITYSIDSHQKQYRLNDGSWRNYAGEIKLSNDETVNTTIYARGIDNAGNISEEVSKLAGTEDKTPPVITLNNYEKGPTNKNILVIATINEGTLNQYSYTFTKNGEFTFVATDNYGNVSEKTVVITNIDKIAPEEPVINIINEEDGSATITIVYSEDSYQKQYKLNNDAWRSYAGVVTIPNTETSTTTIYAKAIDNAGNESNEAFKKVDTLDTVPPVITIGDYIKTPTNQNILVKAYVNEGSLNESFYMFTENKEFTFVAVDDSGNKSEKTIIITNIDKTPPEAPVLNQITEVNGSITVDIEYSLDSYVKEYRIGESDWVRYTGPINLTKNATIYAKGTDEAGNRSKIVFENIEVTIIPKVKSVTISIDYPNGSTEHQYKIDDGEWLDYQGPFEITKNAKIYMRYTSAEGESKEDIHDDVENIDNEPPVAPVISAELQDDNTALVTIDYSLDSINREYKIGDGPWLEYVVLFTVTENTTIYARGTDEAGNVSDIATYDIDIIDDVAPVITIGEYITEPTNQDIIVTATVDKGNLNKDSYKFTKNGQFTFIAIDNFGNKAEKTIIITNIDKELPTISAVIENPNEIAIMKIITVTVSDNNEGFVVTLPDGTTRINEEVIHYEVTKNGLYEFKIVDIAGNEATTSVDTNGKIGNPIFETIDIVYDESMDNREADINVTAESESGIEKIEISRLYTATNTVEMDKLIYDNVTEVKYRVKENATYRITITNGDGAVLVNEVVVGDINTASTAPILDVKINGEGLNKSLMMRTFGMVEPQSNQGSRIEIIATPVYNTSIREIEILKDGLSVASNFYSKTLIHTTSEPGDYEVIATNNKSEKTIQEFTLERGTVTFKTDVSIDNPKANISVNTTVDGNNGVAEIKIEGNGISETIENENSANFEITENGVYTITVTDIHGESESKEVVVEGLVKDFYITYTIDNSEIEEEGIVGITARVVGENDTLTFEDKTVEGNTLTVYVTTDGTYRFTAKQGDTEVFIDVVVDSFANMPPIKIIINRESFESGAVKTTIKAESLDSSNIRRIEIFKDGVSVKRNTYRDNINFEALLNGEYIVKVTNSNGDVAEKAFNVFYVETFIDDSTMNEGYISIGANVTGEIDSLNLGETTTTENTLVVPITESGIYKFKAIKGKTVVTATINIDMYKYIQGKPVVDVETTEKANGVDVKVTATPADGTSIKSISVYKDDKLITSNIYQPTLAFTTTELGIYKAVVTNNKGGVTEKLFEVTYNPVKVEASYNILGTKAVILVNASSVSDTIIEKIELSNGSIVENNTKATFEVTENGDYLITATDGEGNTKTITVSITELNKDLYINLTLDDSLLSTEGYITINANVVGEFDTFMFGEEVLTVNPASINITKDGNYVFTATIGEETISADITVDSFKKLDTKPVIDVTVDDMTISVTARPAYSTSIRSITIFKDEIRVSRNTYRTFLSYTAKDVGTYTIEVLNSKGEKEVKEIVIN